MRHPASQAAYQVARRFETLAAGQRHTQVNMLNSFASVNEDGQACSPACHAGWYAISRENRLPKQTTSFPLQTRPLSRRIFYYEFGANMMARDLGFRHMDKLRQWAGKNPDIWDNPHGNSMFIHTIAFNAPGDQRLTLSHIARHWRNVADQLKAREDAPGLWLWCRRNIAQRMKAPWLKARARDQARIDIRDHVSSLSADIPTPAAIDRCLEKEKELR